MAFLSLYNESNDINMPHASIQSDDLGSETFHPEQSHTPTAPSACFQEFRRLPNSEYLDGIPRTTKDTPITESARLPPFDRALHTRKLCLIGLALSYVLSLAFITIGGLLFSGIICTSRSHYPWRQCRAQYAHYRMPYYPVQEVGVIPDFAKEIILLAFNGIVTVLTECLGYIHGTSLRWALYEED